MLLGLAFCQQKRVILNLVRAGKLPSVACGGERESHTLPGPIGSHSFVGVLFPIRYLSSPQPKGP